MTLLLLFACSKDTPTPTNTQDTAPVAVNDTASADTGDPTDTGLEESSTHWSCKEPELVRADAGANQGWTEGAVTLNAAASTGPGTLSYSWQVELAGDAGEQVLELEGVEAAFEPPEGFTGARVRLVVGSSNGDTHKDFMLVTPGGTAPEVSTAELPPAALGDWIRFTAEGATQGTLVDKPEGSAAEGTDFVADMPGLYSVRFGNDEGDTALSRVHVSAPVLHNHDYAPVGMYRISVEGTPGLPDEAADGEWRPGYTSAPGLSFLDTLGDCPTVRVERGLQEVFHFAVLDAHGDVTDHAYPTLIWYEGPGLSGAQTLSAPGIVSLGIGAASAAYVSAQGDERAYAAALPLNGSWVGPTDASDVVWLQPLSTDGGEDWLLSSVDADFERLYRWNPDSGEEAYLHGYRADVTSAISWVEGASPELLVLASGQLYDETFDTAYGELIAGWDDHGTPEPVVGKGLERGDVDGDGALEVILSHRVYEASGSGWDDWENEVVLLEGPPEGFLALSDQEVRFQGVLGLEASMVVGDVNGDGYDDLVSGADGLATIALGGAAPDWSDGERLSLESPTGARAERVSLSDDRLVLSKAGLGGKGESWVVPLPIPHHLSLAEDPNTALLVGTSEDRLSAGRLADIDLDGDAELVGFGTDQLWWLEL